MKRKNILWISLCTPYSTIPHAGGQTLCHYYDQFSNSDKFDIKFISFYTEDEEKNIKDSLLCNKNSIDLLLENKNTFSRIIDLENRVNPWNRYGGYLSNSRELLLKKALIAFKRDNLDPDFIILQWTEVVVYIRRIKDLFPKAKLIVIEEDIAFLKRERRFQLANNAALRIFHKIRYEHSKKCEINAIDMAEVIVVNNEKDRKLVLENGIKPQKVFLSCAYYKPMGEIGYERKNNDIIFWGSMARKENFESAIWFIDNVMPRLVAEPYRFVVVGSNPPQKLKDKECENVKVTGFVDDPIPYFKNSFCLVAPLANGAGIKVKILEALSAGIPVITNEIGIEGIPATDGHNYFHATNAEEYIDAIHKLSKMDKSELDEFSRNEVNLIKDTFDFEKKLGDLIRLIENM